MHEMNELQMQRAAIQESLCESIFDGTSEAVEFFRFMLTDIERGITTLEKHLHGK